MRRLSGPPAKVCGFLVMAALGLCAADVRGDEARAAEQFSLGSAAFEKGDFKSAARAFEQAYVEAPHPAPLYNAGLAWLGAGRLDHAADAFAAALAMEGLTPEQKADSEKRLGEGQKVLARLRIEGAPAGARAAVDDGPSLPTSGAFHALAGTREVTVVDADGRAEKRSVQVPKADGRTIAVRFDEKAEAPPGPLPTRIVIGLSLLGASAVLGGAAIGTGVAGLSSRDDFVAAQNAPGSTREELQVMRDEAVSLKIATNVLWALSGTAFLSGGVATVLGLVEPRTSSASAAPTVGLTLLPSGVVFHGAF